MKLWTYRFKPVIDGQTVPVALEYTLTSTRLVVHPAGDTSAAPRVDHLNFMNEAYRLQEVEVPSAGGAVRVVVGPRNWWSFGLKVMRD